MITPGFRLGLQGFKIINKPFKKSLLDLLCDWWHNVR
jgi:hypothetical protein